MERILSRAYESPTRVARSIRNNLVIVRQWVRDNPDMARQLLELTWHRLDDVARREFVQWMMHELLRVAKIIVPRNKYLSGSPKPRPFSFRSDELDLDSTIEKTVARCSIGYSDLMVFEPFERKRTWFLMLDTSGSMQGKHILTGCLAVATILLSISPKDYFGVGVFSESPYVLKPIHSEFHLSRLIETMLLVKPDGCTDIRSSLKLALTELNKAGTSFKTGILITDGWQNMGPNPLETARRFSRLHVLALPGGSLRTCQQLAIAGRGRCIMVKKWSDVANAVQICLEDY